MVATTAVFMDAVPPTWSVAFFALMLLAIAFLPLATPHWWERNRNKGIVSLLLALPVVGVMLFLVDRGELELLKAAKEYVAFIVLLGSLFIISGGIYIKGSFAGTPLVNTAFLAIGALSASVIGTTGASMLLIRPLVRANAARKDKAHVVIFFIFIVSNIGGCLTPLGDPPLFLGFLRGVPFEWTLRLLPQWAFANIVLLLVFNLIDQYKLDREEKAEAGSLLDKVQEVKTPLHIQGKINLLLLLGVIAAIYFTGTLGAKYDWSEDVQKAVQVGAMIAMAGLSLALTHRTARESNHFTYGPIIEVAVLFAGIFITMVPALLLLEHHGKDLGVREPWHFFWATGALSSFLDNAPTYLTFTSSASGLLNTNGQRLHELLTAPGGEAILAAISCGAVFMGANTYIGNGPNFMVKAIAEHGHVKMPSFIGYMKWSILVLIPLFVAVTLIFFR